MSRRVWIYSGGRPSNGAKSLCEAGGFLRLRPNRLHKVKPKDIIINWGHSGDFDFDCDVLNFYTYIRVACDKLVAFELLELSSVNTVPWTSDRDQAQSWSNAGSAIVVRNKLTGHSGDGIVIVPKNGEVPEGARLYTKYIFKQREFRVHVFHYNVIDTQRKIKDPDREVTDWKVRSHANGFIFARNNISICPDRDQLAIDAVAALGVDFGAVDIIEDKDGNFYVLEVNTAPGLEGQTVHKYVEAINAYCSAN